MCFKVGWFSGFGKTFQGVGSCNCPPCLKNQLFPKSVHQAFGVLGVPNTMSVDWEEINERGGWILNSRIDRKGGREVGSLPVQPLLHRILSSADSHSFLDSVEITQKSSYGDGRDIFHETCNWEWTSDVSVRNAVSDK